MLRFAFGLDRQHVAVDLDLQVLLLVSRQIDLDDELVSRLADVGGGHADRLGAEAERWKGEVAPDAVESVASTVGECARELEHDCFLSVGPRHLADVVWTWVLGVGIWFLPSRSAVAGS